EKLAEEMREVALTATDTTIAWNYLLQVYSATGRIARTEAELVEYEQYLRKTTPLNVIVMQNYLTKAYYALITGREERIEQLTNEVAAYDESRANMFKCYLPYYSGVYQVPYTENTTLLPECIKTLSGMGQTFASYAEVASYFLGEDHAATADYLAAKRAEGLEPATKFAEARANRLAGRLDEALEIVEEGLLESPGSPDLLLEFAYLQRDLGETEAALETLKKVQDIWSEADENFIPAQRAKALADELAG
ncbi:MAG: tetratricopeptide repeat protein, partial [Bacteroidota bacterium]